MEVEHDSWIALFSILGTGLFLIVSALMGGWFIKRGREEDLYRDLGKLDGRTERDTRDQVTRLTGTSKDFELAIMIGGLKTATETVVNEIAEIKDHQEENRNRQDRSINDLSVLVRGIVGDVDGIKTQIVELRRSVTNLARTMHKKTTPRSS